MSSGPTFLPPVNVRAESWAVSKKQVARNTVATGRIAGRVDVFSGLRRYGLPLLTLAVIRALPHRRQRLSRRQLQILFDRIIADRHVNQRSILKASDELVVLDRI